MKFLSIIFLLVTCGLGFAASPADSMVMKAKCLRDTIKAIEAYTDTPKLRSIP